MPSSCASSSRGRPHNSTSAAALLKPADRGKRRAKAQGPLLVHVPRGLRSGCELQWGRKGRRTGFRDQAQRPAALLLPLHQLYAKAARMHMEDKGVPDNAPALSPAAAALGEGRRGTWLMWIPPPPPTCSPCWELQQQQEPYNFDKFGWNSHSLPGSPLELRPFIASPRKRRFTKSGRQADAQAERQQAALVEQQEQREQQPFCLPPNQQLSVELQRQGDRHRVKNSSHGALSIMHRASTPTRMTPSHMDATGLDFQSTFATVDPVELLAQWHANFEGRKPVRRCLFDNFPAACHNAGQVSEQATPILDQSLRISRIDKSLPLNKGFAQWHANVEGRKPVRRCLFDSFLVGHNAGQVSEQPTPVLDQSLRISRIYKSLPL